MEELNLTNELKALGDMLVAEYRAVLQRKGINATDQLSQTAGVEVRRGDAYLDLSLLLQEYWKYVEYGRRAGKQPPIDAIRKWVEAKPVVPTPDANGRIPTVRSLAYLIARKIGREGTTPRHALQEAQTQTWATAVEQLLEKVAKAEENYIIKQFNA